MLDLSPSLEDYLEAILLLSKNDGYVRVTDLANQMGNTKASASQAIKKLADLKLIKHESYGPVKLTSLGKGQAQKIHRRHKTLRKFLVEVLGVNPTTAEEDACRMEHTISHETMEKLVVFLEKQ